MINLAKYTEEDCAIILDEVEKFFVEQTKGKVSDEEYLMLKLANIGKACHYHLMPVLTELITIHKLLDQIDNLQDALPLMPRSKKAWVNAEKAFDEMLRARFMQ